MPWSLLKKRITWYLNMKNVCLCQKRNEFGKKVRWAYERGSRDYGGRSSMQDFVARVDGKSGTLTSVLKENLIAEYED